MRGLTAGAWSRSEDRVGLVHPGIPPVVLYSPERPGAARRAARRGDRKYGPVIELEFLGTGTSTGVPVIGCDCDTCRSDDPRDTRLRASALIRVDNITLLVDTSPDFRYQMLRSGNQRVDALFYTHTHADHTAGIDDMRRYNALQQEWIPAYVPENALGDLTARFGYAFDDHFPVFGLKPDLALRPITGTDPIEVAGIDVQPVPVTHGTLPILGYRVGSVAYLTDVKSIPDESIPLLQDLEVLVLTALRRFNHPAHMTLDESLVAIEQLRPKRAYLTHIAHEMGRHAEISPLLPDNVQLAHDGLMVRVQDDD
jgi:phosphoribosyl 1,2-cyclic phosphate phosphodiesterase